MILWRLLRPKIQMNQILQAVREFAETGNLGLQNDKSMMAKILLRMASVMFSGFLEVP